MSVLNQLASNQGRRDEEPNVSLAIQIVAANNRSAVLELCDQFGQASLAVQKDAIKVLYEIGERAPELLDGCLALFVGLLQRKDNRLQWGGMTAIASVALHHPKDVWNNLDSILAAARTGSVITRDQCVRTLTRLASVEEYYEGAMNQLLLILSVCPLNQLPLYAESVAEVIQVEDVENFVLSVQQRSEEEGVKESQRKRLVKVIRRVTS